LGLILFAMSWIIVVRGSGLGSILDEHMLEGLKRVERRP
jgi:hypothetical protein